ncbi:MAG TPA: PAS domain S-box protein [Blastocatellia bacterium]|nr:PAS domain S-box protein [Blastocatellia bacterium]
MVQFYESDLFLRESVADFVTTGLRAGETCVVVATPAHLQSFEERFAAEGYDIASLSASGQYLSLDAVETLSTLMADGSPDPKIFSDVIGGMITRAGNRGVQLRIFGEMAGILWREGQYAAAIRLEALWNRLRESHRFHLLCACPITCNASDPPMEALDTLCAEHSQVIPGESYALECAEERLRTVVSLQYKARALEAELAHRREIEKRLRTSEMRYRCLFQASLDGILIVDPKSGTIIDGNQVAAILLGCRGSALMGRELWELGLFQNREIMLQYFRGLRDGQTSRYEQAQVETGDGRQVELEFCSSLYPADGQRIVQCNVRDIAERRRAEEASSHLAAIVESSDDAIVSKSLDGIIQSWNHGAERIFGYTAQEAIGKPIYLIIPEDRYHEEPVVLEKLKRGMRVDHFETVRLTKEGKRVNISLTVSPVRNWSGKIVGASKIARDITDRKRSEAEREILLEREREARADAERANRAKDEFLAIVSHELRTPLNAVLGWVNISRAGTFSEAITARALETIERNARSQAKLIEQLLDVSRIITGKLSVDIRPLEAADAVSAAVDAIRPAAEARNITVRLNIDPDAGQVLADTARLQQILNQLLTNALKFTSSGGSVEVEMRRADSQIEFVITDTGQGIAPEFLPFLFEKFRQGDGSLTRKHGGLGLGLALVRHLVDYQRGSVTADSAGPGKGSTFCVKLPACQSDSSDAPGGDAIIEPHSPRKQSACSSSSGLENLPY